MDYIPFDKDAENLFFQLVPSPYKHASLIVTNNLPFIHWGDVFGGLTIASATIDRIVHFGDVLPLAGDSYRLKNHHPASIAARYNDTTVAMFSVGRNGPIFGWR